MFYRCTIVATADVGIASKTGADSITLLVFLYLAQLMFRFCFLYLARRMVSLVLLYLAQHIVYIPVLSADGAHVYVAIVLDLLDDLR